MFCFVLFFCIGQKRAGCHRGVRRRGWLGNRLGEKSPADEVPSTSWKPPGSPRQHKVSSTLSCGYWGQLSPSHIALGPSSRQFLNPTWVGISALTNACLAPLLSELCPHPHLPPPSLRGGTSVSLNHTLTPIAFAACLLLFLKRQEEEK